MIEEYADQATFDDHMASPVVESLLAYFGSHPEIFAEETVVLTLEPSAGFTRPLVAGRTDPFITFATLEYINSKSAELSLLRWKELRGSVERAEPGVFMYYVCSERDRKNWIYKVEAYESESYWANDHGKSGAVIANKEIDEAGGRSGREILRLRKVGGYLAREEPEKRALL